MTASPIDWKIERPLGEGGQAHTFLVRDPSSGEVAALKRLKNLSRLSRFAQEIQAIQELFHPRLLRLLAFDVSGAKPYFLSPYYPQGSLDKHSTLFERNPAAALRFFAEICDGLSSAHEKGIVHRDIKPANILLADDSLLVLAISESASSSMENASHLRTKPSVRDSSLHQNSKTAVRISLAQK